MAEDCPLNRRNDNFTQAENSQDQPGSSQKRAKPTKSEMPQNRKENPKAKDPKQPVNTKKDKKSEKVSDDKAQEAIKIQEAIDKIFGSVSTIRDIEDDASSVKSLCIDIDYEETLEKEPTNDWAAASGEKDPLQDVQDSTTAKDKADSAKGFKSYCPRCRVDSHTEASCTASLFRQTSKRKISEGEDSKPGKSGKRKDFKRFKSDLAQVVIEGKCADELQSLKIQSGVSSARGCCRAN